MKKPAANISVSPGKRNHRLGDCSSLSRQLRLGFLVRQNATRIICPRIADEVFTKDEFTPKKLSAKWSDHIIGNTPAENSMHTERGISFVLRKLKDFAINAEVLEK